MGKLFAIEAGDGCGKATQTKLLFERFQKEGIPSKMVSFPDYDSDSSGPVRMYLNGDFGNSPDSVNPYAASILYAVDRFASFRKNWKADYDEGKIILADRYATSNLAYQTTKIQDFKEREKFISWIQELEYEKFGIPIPNLVIYLDIDFEVSERLLTARMKESGKSDIHESDVKYREMCHQTYQDIAGKLGWIKIRCQDESGNIKSIEEIHEKIYKTVKSFV